MQSHSVPLLQVALDYVSLPPAIAMALKVAPYVDVIEIGTPLCKWDEQAYNREWSEDDKRTIRQLIDMGFKVTITGGITAELLPFFQDLPVSIIIAGRAIHQAPDPAASALEMRSAIARLWGASQAGVSQTGADVATSDVAAKAIRYGVSEMGLLLTIDGRDCPGCDSPERFCTGSLTTIQCPDGVRIDDLVKDALPGVIRGVLLRQVSFPSRRRFRRWPRLASGGHRASRCGTIWIAAVTL